MRNILLVLIAFLSLNLSTAQTVQDLIDEVDSSRLLNTLNEFSGEVSTVVNGNTVTILNRVSSSGNDLAANYLIEQFNSYNNLVVSDDVYSTSGRNIIATQTGLTQPNNIYIISAHYDAVTNYCADDNASGTAAVLEIARVLSKQCTDTTIVYALWDEEEIGLVGARNYATAAASRGDNILGVLNIDMMGYDGDGDNEFDIDVRNIAGSIAMKDEIVALLNTYNASINLSVNIVDPGTPLSDHKPFWDQGFTALLLGEAWSKNDQNSAYHTSDDRINLIDMSYYHDMVQLCMAYMATKAGVSSNDTSITQTANTLQVNQTGASYQWINCDTDAIIPSATNATYTVSSTGDYAVNVTINGCTEKSNCFNVRSLNEAHSYVTIASLYPNPVKDQLNITLSTDEANLKIYDIDGKLIINESLTSRENTIDTSNLKSGLYFSIIKSRNITNTQKLTKR